MISGTKGRAELAALVLLASAAAAAPAALPVGELAQMLASVESTKARFVETRHSALLKAPLVLQGTLAYRRPDRVEKHVLTPYDERIVVEAGRLTIENRTHNRRQTVAVSGAPGLAALVESIRATRAGDLPALQRHFALQIEGSRERWTLTLRPLDAQVGDYVVSIALSGSGARIAQVTIDETSGDRSVMEIQEQQGKDR